MLWPRVAAAAGVAWPPADAEAAARFIKRTAREGLLPILFAATPEIEPLRAGLASWRALEAANRHRTAALERRITQLPQLLGEDFLLLKGSDLARRLYPSPELRPMGDIDVLVRPERVNAITARLAAANIKPHFSRLVDLSARNPDLAFDLGEVTLEVHRAIVHRAMARIDYDAVWQRRVEARVAGIEAYRLDDADAFLTSVMNIVKDNLAAPLLRHLDLWLMLRDPGLLPEVTERAREWRVRNALQVVLRSTRAIFPDVPAPRPRAFLDRWVAPQSAAVSRDLEEMSRPTRLWRKWWLIDTTPMRLRYALEIGAAMVSGLTHRDRLRKRQPEPDENLRSR